MHLKKIWKWGNNSVRLKSRVGEKEGWENHGILKVFGANEIMTRCSKTLKDRTCDSGGNYYQLSHG